MWHRRSDCMTDSLIPISKAEDVLINIHREHDLNKWSKLLEASPEELKFAVNAVGPFAEDVRQHLEGIKSHARFVLFESTQEMRNSPLASGLPA